MIKPLVLKIFLLFSLFSMTIHCSSKKAEKTLPSEKPVAETSEQQVEGLAVPETPQIASPKPPAVPPKDDLKSPEGLKDKTIEKPENKIEKQKKVIESTPKIPAPAASSW